MKRAELSCSRLYQRTSRSCSVSFAQRPHSALISALARFFCLHLQLSVCGAATEAQSAFARMKTNSGERREECWEREEVRVEETFNFSVDFRFVIAERLIVNVSTHGIRAVSSLFRRCSEHVEKGRVPIAALAIAIVCDAIRWLCA